MIFSDPFYDIQSGEIFVKSKCMQHEHALTNFLHSILAQQGYQSADQSLRIWNNGNRRAVVVLADDFGVCRPDFTSEPYNWFSDCTVVITDNHMPCSTQYQVCRLPVSYFGAFSYRPANQCFDPQYRFGLSINRMDHQRIIIFLELLKHLPNMFEKDLVNFNAWDPGGNNNSSQDLSLNFQKYFGELDESIQDRYSNQSLIQQQLPVRNHNFNIEQTHVSSYVNLVIETYAGNYSMAFSEKIFRALVTPAPWTVFSAHNAVSYIKSLGFDTLDDIVDHSYDQVAQQWPWALNKIQCYLDCSLRTYNLVKNIPIDQLRQRCQVAALTNQNLLKKFKKQWPGDFADWMHKTIRFLQ